jgi:hypothetical protein
VDGQPFVGVGEAGWPCDAGSPGEPGTPEARVARCLLEFRSNVWAAEDEEGFALIDEDLVAIEAERGRVKWRSFRHEFLRAFDALSLERHDDCDLFVPQVGLLARKRGEEFGELVEKPEAERHYLNDRSVVASEHQCRAAVQALFVASADTDITQLGVRDAQLNRISVVSADEHEALVVDDQRPGCWTARSCSKENGIAGGFRPPLIQHLLSIATLALPCVGTRPPSACGQLRSRCPRGSAKPHRRSGEAGERIQTGLASGCGS